MTAIEIRRRYRYSQSIGGELLIEGKPVCQTLELPWRWNEKDISCIPAGTYSCWWRHERGRIQLWDIPCPGGYRTGVQIHVGNQPKQIQGCILVATTVSPNFAH